MPALSVTSTERARIMTKAYDACPICGAVMGGSSIRPICPTFSCPVTDDALLWYQNNAGEWKRQHFTTRGDPASLQGARMVLSKKVMT